MMKKIKVVTNMKLYRFNIFATVLFACLFVLVTGVQSQNKDKLPAEFREYTNPEEIVTFDRTTAFSRALDVINEFAQEYRGKIVLDRTQTEGNIGISVPAMHWMDALKLILKVKGLMLLEQVEFFEIVTVESQQSPDVQTQAATGDGGGEGPVATTQTHEVRINAIFFEGNRRALQEIGVDWSTISENVPEAILGGGQQGGGGQGGQGSGTQIPNSGFNGPFVQVNSKGAQNVSQEVFNALVNIGEIGTTGISVQALFSAFEADNLGEILASPTVKVMDGEDGRIQVGQDFSIKQRDIAGNVIEDFFSVGTILEVTPQVIEQNDTTFVHLDIIAERSTAQPDPVSTIINKQEASTQALLLDGEATVIAGLYSTERSEVRRGVPILKDLPPWVFGLRYLFGYNSTDTSMRELVILLQASIEPTIPERIANAEDEGFRNKYEVLRDERQRMRQEVEESDKAKITDSYDDLENLESNMNKQNNLDESEPQPQETEQSKSQQQDTTQKTSEKEQPSDQQEEDKEEAPAISDPEVKTEKVELNLGGDDESQEQEGKAQQNNEQVETEKSDQAQQEMSQDTPTKNYYIIGGAFRQPSNAKNFRNQLAEKGYGDAVLVRKKDNGWMFVAYNAYDDLGNAQDALNSVQQENSEAWLYRAN